MKTIVVTGATSGIGLAVCEELLHHQYRVIGIGRTAENCERAKDSLLAAIPAAEIAFYHGDLMQQTDVRRVAGEIMSDLERESSGSLHALINNAGCVRSWYSTSDEGYEQQFALNHLAGFLLTHYLLSALRIGRGRIIMTGSASHNGMKIRWNDLMFKKRYHPLLAYKQSKLCNMLFAEALNDRFSESGIRAYVVDPGLVATDIGNKQTGSLVSKVWSMRKARGVSPKIPAATYTMLCDQAPAPDGFYYYLCRKKSHSREVNGENAQRLFAVSEKLCGIQFGRDEQCEYS